MTVLRYIDNHRLPPAEQEVAHSGAQHHGNAEPNVVRHKDQHQHKGERHLQDVETGLIEMIQRQHGRTVAGGKIVRERVSNSSVKKTCSKWLKNKMAAGNELFDALKSG